MREVRESIDQIMPSLSFGDEIMQWSGDFRSFSEEGKISIKLLRLTYYACSIYTLPVL